MQTQIALMAAMAVYFSLELKKQLPKVVEWWPDCHICVGNCHQVKEEESFFGSRSETRNFLRCTSGILHISVKWKNINFK